MIDLSFLLGTMDLVMPLGSGDWEIYPSLNPQMEDKIIDKSFNSALKKTDLKEYIDDQEISQLVIVGMQTEYCIDSTIKSAFDLDISFIVPFGLTSTFDNSLMSSQTLIAILQKYGKDALLNYCLLKTC